MNDKLQLDWEEVDLLGDILEDVITHHEAFYKRWNQELEFYVAGEFYQRKIKEFKIVKARKMKLKKSEQVALWRVLWSYPMEEEKILDNNIRNGILDKLNRINLCP